MKMATFTVLFSNDKKSTVVFGAVRQCLQAIYKKSTVFLSRKIQYFSYILIFVLYFHPILYSTKFNF